MYSLAITLSTIQIANLIFFKFIYFSLWDLHLCYFNTTNPLGRCFPIKCKKASRYFQFNARGEFIGWGFGIASSWRYKNHQCTPCEIGSYMPLPYNPKIMIIMSYLRSKSPRRIYLWNNSSSISCPSTLLPSHRTNPTLDYFFPSPSFNVN